ncbi:MAG: FeoB-associated Cys-rich membrane protein [Chloroflexi bacterium]|jgi:hypothetical protein|nr:FeoB-associated Cys-rich membrane protein [Chloroflexota bacterium]
MLATIIISAVLAGIIGVIVYRLIKNAKSGSGKCAGCAYAKTCTAARYLVKEPDCNDTVQLNTTIRGT